MQDHWLKMKIKMKKYLEPLNLLGLWLLRITFWNKRQKSKIVLLKLINSPDNLGQWFNSIVLNNPKKIWTFVKDKDYILVSMVQQPEPLNYCTKSLLLLLVMESINLNFKKLDHSLKNKSNLIRMSFWERVIISSTIKFIANILILMTDSF